MYYTCHTTLKVLDRSQCHDLMFLICFTIWIDLNVSKVVHYFQMMACLRSSSKSTGHVLFAINFQSSSYLRGFGCDVTMETVMFTVLLLFCFQWPSQRNQIKREPKLWVFHLNDTSLQPSDVFPSFEEDHRIPMFSSYTEYWKYWKYWLMSFFIDNWWLWEQWSG